MSIYQRYFKIPAASPLVAIMKRAVNEKTRAREELKALQKKYGADEVFHWDDGRFAGFHFKGELDTALWCKPDKRGLVTPKQNTKEGKAVAAEIDAVTPATTYRDVFREAGLGHGEMLLVGDFRGYSAGLFYVAEPHCMIISVPWQDVDPDELDRYQADKNHMNSNLDHLLWAAPEDWVEVKEWEAKKAQSEAEEGAKAAA